MLGLVEPLDLGDLLARDAADDGIHRLARRLDDLGEVDLDGRSRQNQAAKLRFVLERQCFELPAAGSGVWRLLGDAWRDKGDEDGYGQRPRESEGARG